MKNYLSFGGGVNSVAAYLLGGFDEAVFVDTGSEYPETYEYIEMFTKKYPLTIIKPDYGIIYDYCWEYKMVPAIYPRWCTVHFKIKPFANYVEKPCFKLLGFSTDESHRAVLSVDDGIEHRFPLLENEISRDGCKQIIKDHGLPIPHRSKCFICPFQTVYEWKELRINHQDLFCKAEQHEQRNIEYRKSKGKPPMYLSPRKASLRAVVEETQGKLFKRDEYPPCNCML